MLLKLTSFYIVEREVISQVFVIPKDKSNINKARKQWLFVFTLFIVIITLYTLRGSIAICYIYGVSMEPTLINGSLVYVDRKVTDEDINRGDIIAFKGKYERWGDWEVIFVKRVIGLEGDTVEIKNNKVYVNGDLFKEPYLADFYKELERQNLMLKNMEMLEVPEGKLFVMGDNRVQSIDSRNGLGFASYDTIVGRYEHVIIEGK